MRTFLIAVLAGGFLALAAAASAAPPQHFQFEFDPVTVVHEPCGAVETITVTILGAEYFDTAGNSTRFQVHFHYVGRITVGGVTVRDEAHQNAIFRPSGINTLNGQGIAFHLPGRGLVFQDIGHLVFSDQNGTTIRGSAKVRGFDDPEAPDFSAVLCAALG